MDRRKGMMYRNTSELDVPKSKLAITLEHALLQEVDDLVARGVFSNRSQAIEAAVLEKLDRYKKTRLINALSELDPLEEKAIAEEGMGEEHTSWPEY